MRIFVFFIIFVDVFFLTESANGAVLTNKAFQNFDLKCSPTETIFGMVFKKFVSANGTADLELTLLCRSVAGTADPAPVANESTCRYGDKFRLQNNATVPGRNTDCKPDEYISGISGTFEKSYRILRLRCCKAINGHQDDTIGCRTMGPESITAVAVTGLRDPAQTRSGCPLNVLSSFFVARGKLTAKYCAFAIDGAKYESYCFSDQQKLISSFSNDFPNTPKNDFTAYRPFPPRRFNLLQPVEENEETKYGESFRIECKSLNDAMDRFEARSVDGPDGIDLLYKFSCKPVTNENQKAVKKRVTKFVHINETEKIYCYDNETMCSFYGSFNRTRQRKRRYAFGCCEGSNWYVNSDVLQETQAILRPGEEKQILDVPQSAGADGYKIVSFAITIVNTDATITAAFQSYQYESETRFTKNVTQYEYKSPVT